MKKPTERPKMYVVRKYIKATNATQAILKDKTTKVHDVYIDAEWQSRHLPSAIGFHVIEPENEED
jgi:hypothetical protein